MGGAKEIDHEFTDGVICPYCGYALSDSWEFDDGDCANCPKCEREFIISVHHTIEYSTDVLKAPQDIIEGVALQPTTAPCCKG
jgi:hypothetical protein